MRLIFVGPPGVGKGTQSQRLVAKWGIPHLSTGEMLRQAIREGTEVGRISDALISKGQLAPDEIVLRIMRGRLDQPDCQRGYLLDGFPRTLVQAEALDEFLAERGVGLSAVLELVVDEEQILSRLAARNRADDDLAIVRARLKHYNEQTSPLIEYYRQRKLLNQVDGTGPPDVVFGRIDRLLDSISAPKPAYNQATSTENQLPGQE
jgi:adenylate kinase